MSKTQQCLLGMFLALLSDELQRPGMVVAEKLLAGCRDWTRSSGQLLGSVDNSLSHLSVREKTYVSEREKKPAGKPSLFLPHLWQHFVLNNIGSRYFSKGALFWPICIHKVFAYCCCQSCFSASCSNKQHSPNGVLRLFFALCENGTARGIISGFL